jgi:hypothetical protein
VLERLVHGAQRVRAWWRRLRGHGQTVTLQPASASRSVTASRARLTIGPRDHGSFSSDRERIEYLFAETSRTISVWTDSVTT